MMESGALVTPQTLVWVASGANYATRDVDVGYLRALQRLGHNIYFYDLNGRMESSKGWLEYAWKRYKRHNKGVLSKELLPRPTNQDVEYLSEIGVVEKALRTQADWVVIVAVLHMIPDVVILLKRAGFRVAMSFTESPYSDKEQDAWAKLADLCWTNDLASVERLRKACPETYFLHHVFEPRYHRPLSHESEDEVKTNGEKLPWHDVLFIGTGFPERVKILQEVDWTGLDLRLYGWWTTVGSRSKLRPYLVNRLVPNNAAAWLYRFAKVNLNLFRTSATWGRHTERVEGGISLNPRIMELAACGVFTLSEYRPEVPEVFGDLVPTFRTSEELSKLVRYYLAHPDERLDMARRLPACIEHFTFDENVRKMSQDLENYDQRYGRPRPPVKDRAPLLEFRGHPALEPVAANGTASVV